MLRTVEPLVRPADVLPNQPATDRPTFAWVPISQLRINDAYQRGLSDRSIKLIYRIAADFDWRRLKPLIVTAVGDGTFEVIDGQHTAIAAATHGQIDALPVLIVVADEMTARAGAFLGHNRDRVTMQAPQLFHAAVAAGDEDALTVAQVCARAGVNILRMPPASGNYRPGDCIAVAVLRQLVAKRSAIKARMVLEACVKANATPVSSTMIKAVDAILNDRDYAGTIHPDDLVVGLIALPKDQARIVEQAAAKSIPVWRATVIVLYQVCKKRRAA